MRLQVRNCFLKEERYENLSNWDNGGNWINFRAGYTKGLCLLGL